MHQFAVLRLALPTPLRRLFDYLPPESMSVAEALSVPPGVRVLVPFGRRGLLVGVLVEVACETPVAHDKLKAATQVLDALPILSAASLQLCEWTANYYQHALGEVIQAALPVKLRKGEPAATQVAVWEHKTEGKGLGITALKRSPKQQAIHQFLLANQQLKPSEIASLGLSVSALKCLAEKGLVTKRLLAPRPSTPSTPRHGAVLRESPQQPNDEQAAALAAIRYHEFNPYLLEGVTGSGKTEVYLHAIGRTLQAGRQALVLVPEIGLAPQTLARFARRFCVPIAELHSSVSEGERAKNWLAAANGEARIVIGTRLSLFTPLPELGIIVVDEEHDSSFKQNDGLRYSARDLAIVRARLAQVPLLLGSATPSLETLHNALSGRYQHLHLVQRAGDAQPPSIRLLDMRLERVEAGLAQTSLDAVEACLLRGEQAMVFINRRGFAPALLCHHCGWSANCRRCDARLTLHATPYHLHCHHCDAQAAVPKTCPGCHSHSLAPIGQGTERAEALLSSRLPNATILRVDQDSMQRKTAMAELQQQIHSGAPCLLVGTQMLAKGHHFPRVTLVVIVDADQGLLSGDFRGPERMGQLITQVAGRAGRETLAGEVLLQTYRPDHPLLQRLVHEGYANFSRQILAERQAVNLPPYWAMAVLRAESKQPQQALDFLREALEQARLIAPPSPHLQYLGPIPALMEKRNEVYRYQLQLKSHTKPQLQQLLKPLIEYLESHPPARSCRWSLDVDPQEFN